MTKQKTSRRKGVPQEKEKGRKRGGGGGGREVGGSFEADSCF